MDGINLEALSWIGEIMEDDAAKRPAAERCLTTFRHY